MAPVGAVGILSWFSSPEVAIISLVAFLVLSITLLTLCARCRRGNNAYDVSGNTNDGTSDQTRANGNSGTKSEETDGPETAVYSTWRNHKNMPPNTLESA